MAEGLGAWGEKLREMLVAKWMQGKTVRLPGVYAVVSSASLWPVLEGAYAGRLGEAVSR